MEKTHSTGVVLRTRRPPPVATATGEAGRPEDPSPGRSGSFAETPNSNNSLGSPNTAALETAFYFTNQEQTHDGP